MMNLFVWCPGGQCQFVNSSQATVLRRYRVARRFPIPKCQQIQPRDCKVLPAPRDIDTDDINLSVSDLGETRDHVNEVFESANITGICIVHPSMDIDEKKGALCPTNHIDRSCSL